MVYQRREVFYQGNQLFHSIKPFRKELYTQWKRKNQTDGLGMIFNFPKKVSAPIAFVSMHFPLLIHPLFLRFFFFFTFLKLAGNSFQPTGRPAVASTRTHTYIWPQLTFRLGLGCLCNTYALQQASSQIAGQISPARRKNEKQAQPFSSPSPSHHYVVLLTVQKVTQHPTVETGRQTAERDRERGRRREKNNGGRNVPLPTREDSGIRHCQGNTDPNIVSGQFCRNFNQNTLKPVAILFQNYSRDNVLCSDHITLSSIPTSPPFSILEPQNPWFEEFYGVPDRCATDFRPRLHE